MDRKQLKQFFNDLLINTDFEHHLECKVHIDNDDDTTLIGIFKDQTDNNIYFYIYGDCIVEFDDMATNYLINILNALKEKYNIETNIIN